MLLSLPLQVMNRLILKVLSMPLLLPGRIMNRLVLYYVRRYDRHHTEYIVESWQLIYKVVWLQLFHMKVDKL